MPPRATRFLTHPYKCPGGMGGSAFVLKVLLELLREIVAHHLPSPLFLPFLFMCLRALSFPYPVSPVFATHTKTAGCVPTIPTLERAGCPERFEGSPLPVTSHESPVTFLPLLHYPLHFGRTACRPATTPGNCFASTPLPRACANTCLPSKPVSAPTPAKPAPMKKPGASLRCCTISITSAGPTRSTPPIRGILRKARRFCANRATPRKSSAPFSPTRTIATFRANPRWSTRSSPATSSPASSLLAPTSARRKAFSILRWTP